MNITRDWVSLTRYARKGSSSTDPEVQQYAQEIGHSLSSQAEEGQHQFYYFVIREPEINA